MRLLVALLLLGHAALARAEVSAAAAQALLGAWLRAQNQGDFAAYQALYASDFRGVRRSGKQAVPLDREGWLKDRARMFRKPMKVSASAPQVSREGAAVVLLFEQTWASGTYRDVGQKRLVVVEEGGAARIGREELLASDLRPEPLKPEEAALVRCLFPAFDEVHRKVGGALVQRVQGAPSPPEQLVVVELAGRPPTVGVCGPEGKALGAASLPERESLLDACQILDASGCQQHEERVQLGPIRLRPRLIELAPGQWAFGVERGASADSSDEQGPGEEVRVTTLYAFRLGAGKLERVLTVPIEGGRSDVELSDSFQSDLAQDRPGQLRLLRTIRKGVYPDGVKERTQRLRYRWNGRQLSGG